MIAGAKLEDEMGGNYYDQLGGPVTFASHSWFFTLEGTVEAAVAYYSKNLPPGANRMEGEEGEVAFEWLPPGSAEGEEVTVRIEAGRLQITEVVKAKDGG